MKNFKAPIETCSPLIDELFYTANDISDELLEQILALPRNDLISDLQRTLNYAIEHYDDVKNLYSEEGNRTSFAMHALFLLTELKAEEGFPVLLKLSKCDEEWLDLYFGDYTTECMWQDAMILGYNQVNASVQFFKEGGCSSYSGNCVVSGGLTKMYLHYPEKQQEVQNAFREILEYLWAKPEEEDYYELNELILNAVADTKAAELYPLCKPFYDEDRTQRFITSDWEEFSEVLTSFYTHKNSVLSIRERLSYFMSDDDSAFNEVDEVEDFPDIDFANYQPIRSEPKIQRNDPCPCGSGLKYKKCCLKKEEKLPD